MTDLVAAPPTSISGATKRFKCVKIKLPPTTATFTTKNGTVLTYSVTKMRAFYRWMWKRHLAFLNRLDYPDEPDRWTDDKRMAALQSCCVFRELDRYTQYELIHVIRQGSQGYEEMFFRIVLFRLFNKPETWTRLSSELGGIPAYANFAVTDYVSHFKAILKDDPGYTFSSGSYQMTAPKHGSDLPDYQLKLRILDRVMTTGLPETLLEISAKNRRKNGTYPVQQALIEISSYPLFGRFLGYQLLLDLSYLPHLDFDLEQWASTGPGSQAGLARLFRPSKFKVAPFANEAMKHIRDSQWREWDRLAAHVPISKRREYSLPPSLPGSHRKGVGLVEIEHALCEFEKYERHGDGKAKKFGLGGPLTTVLPPPKIRVSETREDGLLGGEREAE